MHFNVCPPRPSAPKTNETTGDVRKTSLLLSQVENRKTLHQNITSLPFLQVYLIRSHLHRRLPSGNRNPDFSPQNHTGQQHTSSEHQWTMLVIETHDTVNINVYKNPFRMITTRAVLVSSCRTYQTPFSEAPHSPGQLMLKLPCTVNLLF